MRYLAIVVVALVGCTREASGPACKAALEKAHAAGIHMTPTELTVAIGTCVEQEWPAEARACIAAAGTDRELETCASRFKLDGGAVHVGLDVTQAIAKMAELKDQMCACKDTPCAQKVSDAMVKWSQEQSKNQRRPPKMTQEQTEQATQIGEQMGRCMQKAMGGSGNAEPRQDPLDGRARERVVE